MPRLIALSALAGCVGLIACSPANDAAHTSANPPSTSAPRVPAPEGTSSSSTSPTLADAGAGGPGLQDAATGNSAPIQPHDAVDAGAEAGAGVGRTACVAPPGVNTAPRDYHQLLTLINALPRPTTVACFLESLQRPLQLNLVNSLISAQPAEGRENPRVFIYIEPMVYSVVPAGDGAPLLEMSYLVSDTRSIKAEVVFPVVDVVTEQQVADHVLRTTGTTCGLCHAAENLTQHPAAFPGLFESAALKPRDVDQVLLSELQLQHELCDPRLEAERCAILSALLDHGPTLEWQFPEAMETFF